jgi:hypothetical protein
MACELPSQLGVPLSRLHVPDIRLEILRRGLVAEISGTTIWRWLSRDAIRPWSHRSWIFPRDPQFAPLAARVLDLYARTWEGKQLGPNEYVVCADEKPGIQIRRRLHPIMPCAPGRPLRVEHEYRRLGTLGYLAAWDCHNAKVFGRCEEKIGIEAFDRLVETVMSTPPYSAARRVFWVVDNGTAHRGDKSVERIARRWPSAQLVHLPIHSSWLNQVEIYFSIVQRKVLSPDSFDDAASLAQRLNAFETRYQATARPFEWKFTRTDLAALMSRLRSCELTEAA